MKHISAKEIISLMNEWAPKELAESWDNPGLQVGNKNQLVKKILVALDLTPENIDYAIKNNVEMIITHHPFFFKGIKRIDLTEQKGKFIEKLIKNNILLFAAHTNLDTAKEGVNDALAEKLELKEIKGLVPVSTDPQMKITFVVEEGNLQSVKDKIYAEEFADFIYETNLTGHLTKIEIKIAKHQLTAFLSQLPLSEIRDYDISAISDGSCKEYMGRIGYLAKPMEAKEALLFIKNKLGIVSLKYSGNIDKVVRKIAVLGGAGSEFASIAFGSGADIYLTGDVKYHEAQGAEEDGGILVDGGHYCTERVIIPTLSEKIRNAAIDKEWKVEVLEDTVSKDIFSYC